MRSITLDRKHRTPMMQALVLEDSLRLGQLPRPEPTSTEALVRVHACAISRADLDMISGRSPVQVRPVILGHQFVGTVEAVVDPGLERWIGKRVVARTHNGCGRCLACRKRQTWLCEAGRAHGVGFGLIDGAFADFVNVPSAALVEVADNVDDDEATFVHPMAVALQAVAKVEGPAPQRVLVVGDGNMGLLVTLLLHAAGHAVTVFGRHPSRRDLLWHSGIGFTGISEGEDPSKIDSLERQSYGTVFECSGQSNGFVLASSAVRPRGRLILLSQPDTKHSGADLRFLVDREAELVGVSAGPIEAAVEYLGRKTLDLLPLIASRHRLSEGVGATQTALRRGTLKVILENDQHVPRRAS